MNLTGCKHANADILTVSGTFLPDWFELIVSDNGQGFDLAEMQTRELGTSGAGLRTMQRRTELIDGSLQIESAVGQGTLTLLTLPATAMSK